MSYIAEKNVIGSLFIDGESISQIYGIIESYMFTSEVLGLVYKEFCRGYDNQYEVNLALIEQRLKSDNYPTDIVMLEIKECITQTNTSATIKSYANIILSDYKANRLDKFLGTIKVTPNNFNEQIRAISQELEVLQDKRQTKSKTLPTIVKENKDKYFKEREVKPINIGFPKLDDMLGGLECGDLIIIGARPGVGKSALVTQITTNLEKQGKRIGFYNLEMSDKQMYERFIVNESGIPLTRLRKAVRFLGDEQERFAKANEKLEKAENIIITSVGAKSVNEIRCESKHMDYDVIIIDYLQLLKAETTYRGNRTAEVGEISRNLKSLAMELGIPIIALSQLNRVSEGRENKEPTMSELREAGNIEQDASVIMLMWNLNEDDDSMKGCKVAKQRQGECGKVVMRFNGSLMRFEETDEDVKSVSGWKKVDDNNPFI